MLCTEILVFHCNTRMISIYTLRVKRRAVQRSYYRDLKSRRASRLTLLNPPGHVMHQQFNIQQLYVLPTLYLCVLYLSENKQRLVALTA